MTPPCEICEAQPPCRYECTECKRAVCEACRTPRWTAKGKRWTCTSECVVCHVVDLDPQVTP